MTPKVTGISVTKNIPTIHAVCAERRIGTSFLWLIVFVCLVSFEKKMYVVSRHRIGSVNTKIFSMVRMWFSELL
jgi:hypothetical protein